MPATTAEALRAKARIMPAMIDNCDRSLEDEDEAFLLSFAADVKAFLEPIIEQNWHAANAAKDAAASH